MKDRAKHGKEQEIAVLLKERLQPVQNDSAIRGTSMVHKNRRAGKS